MIFGVILAGGERGAEEEQRMPMQYMPVGGKPVLIHTMEKFLIHDKIDRILVLCPEKWLVQTEDMVQKYLKAGVERIAVLPGGSTRNETIIRAVDYIEEQGQLTEETLIVTHDSIRPFVTYRIIEENILCGEKYGAADTVIHATDTIVYSEDKASIGKVPDRAQMYQGQTPQTFRADKLRKLYKTLSEEEKAILTDACKIYLLKGEPVHLVEGEVFNTKITYSYDLKVAEALLYETEHMSDR